MIPMVMIFNEALAVDRSQMNTRTSTIDHVIANDFRLSTGLREATGRLTMSRDLSRDDRCSTQQCNIWASKFHTRKD